LKSLLSETVEGYEEIEPCIITALALGANIFIEGRHGTGKTQIGKTLGQAMDKSGRGFRFFDAPKAGMISIGGLPDMEKSSRTGNLEFIESKQSIWGTKILLVDELPRADKEKQNYWLEIFEERTFQGKPVNYDMAIATGNLATYKGNFEMDLALKSRFLFWLPAPDFQQVDSNDVVSMIRLNLEGGRPPIGETGEKVAIAINAIRDNYANNMKNDALVDQVATFIGTFTQFIKDKISDNHTLVESGEAYIPPREFANHMIHAILGLKAYFNYMKVGEALRLAGQYTIKYVIETRHAAAGTEFTNICNIAWRQLSGLLVGEVDSPEGRIKYKYASAISSPQKIEFWKSHLNEAIRSLNDADLTNMAGETLQQINKESVGLIGPFWHIMRSDDKTAHIANQTFGCMYTEVDRKLLAGRYNPESGYAKLWDKYKLADTLTADQVADILSA
jgi:hypothetical protein